MATKIKTLEELNKWLKEWGEECELAKGEKRGPNPFFDTISYREYSTIEILSLEMDEIHLRNK